MNPKYHLLAAAAALSLGACSTDDTGAGLEKGSYKLSFTIAEDSETRTTLDAGDNLRWGSTDQVGVYTLGQNVNFNALTVADVNQSPVVFSGVMEESVTPGDQFYAYYPYDAKQSTDPAAVILSIPEAQTQTVAGVYNGRSNPLVALPMELSGMSDSLDCRISSVRFRQLGAIVELQLSSSSEALRSESICSVTFEADTPLAGDFQFDLTTVKVDGELPIAGYESKVVATLLEEPAVIPATGDEVARVYLTIAPGTYTGKIVVNTDVAQYTFSLAKALNFERAVIKGLPADFAKAEREMLPDAFIPFEDAEVKQICIENWDTNGDCELSCKEAAAVTSIGTLFREKSINSFNELRYFTGLQSIENQAFMGCSSLTSINIPEGVMQIGHFAFCNCSSLTNINIPEEVTAIGSYTFANCSSLTSINIPDRVTKIESATFYGCSRLTSINIPEGVTAIGEGAFNGCSSLASINIPEGVTKIGGSAFASCTSLTSIRIPEGVTTIENNIFNNCSSLTSIKIPDSVTAIENGAISFCSSLTSIDIPNGVTTIGDQAFTHCSSLTSINLPNGVTKIGGAAFDYCSSLTSINIPQTVSSIGEGAFVQCSSLSAFYGKYASADNRCLIQDGTLLAFAPAGLTKYTIPEGATAIGAGAYEFCTSLTSINIPEGVTEIGRFAFDACISLTSVYCKPTNPPALGSYAFDQTPSSMKIYVPAASVEAYKTAQGWSGYASQIIAVNN